MQITKQTARQMSRSATGVNDYVFVTFISSLFSHTAFFLFCFFFGWEVYVFIQSHRQCWEPPRWFCLAAVASRGAARTAPVYSEGTNECKLKAFCTPAWFSHPLWPAGLPGAIILLPDTQRASRAPAPFTTGSTFTHRTLKQPQGHIHTQVSTHTENELTHGLERWFILYIVDNCP